MELLNLLLFAQQQGTQDKNPLSSFLPLILIIVVFYFFMIRPQTRKQKELKNFRGALKKGDKIITTGGIYGKITEINEGTVIIEVENQVRLKVDKAAIVRDPSDMAPQNK